MITQYVVSHINTPIGTLEVSGTAKGVATISFLNDEPSEFRNAQLLEQPTEQLRQYFEGNRTEFHSLKLHFPATDFQRSVWDALDQVPFGEVVTYGELAEMSGYKGAARAVGTAMKVNPLPILIPCHRVLPADKTLGEYAFGSERKQWLLQLESVAIPCPTK